MDGDGRLSQESLLDKIAKIQDLDAKYIYLLIFLGCIIPTIFPLGLPVGISEPTKEAFNTVNSLPPGSTVLFATDIGFVTMPETYGAMLAVLQHITSLEGVKIVFTSRGTNGNDILQMGMRLIYGSSYIPNKEYGTDYIIMPYIPGASAFVKSIADDFQNTYRFDYFGTPVEELPLFSEITNGADIDLIVEFCHGPQFYDYLGYFNAAYGTPIIISVVAYIYGEVMPYYTTGQFVGYMVGLRGAGEYEQLVNKPGIALKGADALSGSYIWMLTIIIVGNVANAVKRFSSGGS